MTEELVELGDLELDEQEIIRNLILYASLLLKRPTAFLLGREATAEMRNDNYYKLAEALGFKSCSTLLHQKYCHWFDNLLLPDVCGCCYRTIGECSGGNVRWFCRICYSDPAFDKHLAAERKMELHRISPWGSINTLILCQLIYKYYSPEGDSQWQLVIPKSLT